jgi:ABC-2 type transport system ATP-binding protein
VSATAPPHGGSIISVRGVTKRFGDFVAVDDLSFEVATGSVFAFLGANGSGKSTSIRMMIGILAPTAGEIELDGVDVIRHPRRVRERIGYMGQKVSLYAGLTLRENVEFYAGLHGLAGAALEARWSALRERFSLTLAERERPENLPAGIRQRAGLALATLHQPRVLFLDEPTAGVDVRSRALFWELIRDESDAGVTVFVTTHFLEEVDYCDWVCFIDEGKLIANAAPEALRARFGGGYRIGLELAAADRGTAPALRGALARDGLAVGGDEARIEIRATALDDDVLAPIARALAAHPGSRVHVDPPEMVDVFRRMLA